MPRLCGALVARRRCALSLLAAWGPGSGSTAMKSRTDMGRHSGACRCGKHLALSTINFSPLHGLDNYREDRWFSSEAVARAAWLRDGVIPTLHRLCHWPVTRCGSDICQSAEILTLYLNTLQRYDAGLGYLESPTGKRCKLQSSPGSWQTCRSRAYKMLERMAAQIRRALAPHMHNFCFS